MKYPKVSIIVLNWNGWKDTIECLESLYNITYPNYEVIVVDNRSDNKSVEKIREWAEGKITVSSNFFKYNQNNKPIKCLEFFEQELLQSISIKKKSKFNSVSPNKKLLVIKNEQNYGFAEGNNVAMRWILKENLSEYIFLLNNDTVVEKSFLEELINVSENNDDIVITGPLVFFYDFYGQKDRVASFGGKLNSITGNVTHLYHGKKYNKNIPKISYVNFIEGSAMLIKCSKLSRKDLMNKKYFLYMEDVDFCYRFYKNNMLLAVTSMSKIWHKVSASNVSNNKIYYLTRNLIWFMRENTTPVEYMLFLLHLFIIKIPYTLIVKKVIFKKELLKFFVKGVNDGFIDKI